MFLAVLSALAMAQPDPQAIAGCTSIEDPTARLACYDEAAGRERREGPTAAVSAPRARPAAPVAPVPAPAAVAQAPTAQEAIEEERRWFGLNRPVEHQVEEISLSVVDIHEYSNGAIRVTLDDGQVWRQLDSDRVRVRIRSTTADQVATVRRGALGNYRLRLEPLGRTIRVRRVE